MSVGAMAPEAIMRFMIYATALMLVLATPFEVGAQTTTTGPSTTGPSTTGPSATGPSTVGPSTTGQAWPPGLREAPIGHRQPTAQSVGKAEEQKGENPQSQKGDNSKSQTRGVDLDKNLMICRGC
jgi:hypothetical protein